MRIRRIAVATSAAVLAALALGACGGDDEEKDNTKTEAQELADQAVAATKKLEFVTNNGTATDEDGNAGAVQACAVLSTKAIKGTRQIDGETVQVISVGGFQYTKASGKFWAKASGRPSREALYEQVVGDKWFKMESEDSDLDFFEGATGAPVKGEVTDFHGKQAIPLTITKDGAKKTYFVAAKGDPVIIGQIQEGPEAKERTETEISKTDKCDAAVPPADQTITADEVNKKAAELQGA